MAKTQAEEMRVKRSDVQMTAALDPREALNGLEPLFQVGNKWLEHVMAMSSELLEFSRARIDRNIEASKAIARSTSIDQAVDLQTDFARSMVQDYLAEAGKLADFGSRAMLDSLSAWQPAMREQARRGAD
jgi:hypothetical protein